MSRLKYAGVSALLIVTVVLAMGCARNRASRENGRHAPAAPAGPCYSEDVRLNGTTQRINVRGDKPNAPVILWLDGVPGGVETGMVSGYLKPLYANFIVVTWNQRGTSSNPLEAMKTQKVEDYVKDTIALSQLLNNRFHRKVYLVGRGWGSVLGIKAVASRPELYLAYVGVAQRVNTEETDKAAYQVALEGTGRFGDAISFAKLKQNGPPPYTAAEPGKYDTMFVNARACEPRSYNTPVIDPAKTYGVDASFGDRSSLQQRRTYAFNYLYPQLNKLDFEKQVTELKVPCFFVVGRWDFITPGTTTERYASKLQAPVKDVVWFERSGNYACFQEPEKFTDYMVNTVVPRSKAAATQPAQ